MLETVIPGVIIIIVLVVMLIINRLKVRGLEELAERNLHDRRAVVNFLNRFAHSVSTADNIDNAIIALARYISDAIHARSLCIFFAEKDAQQLKAQAIIGPFPTLEDFDSTFQRSDEEIKNKTCKVGDGLIGRIAAGKKPVLIRSSEDALLGGIKEGVEIETAMMIPVVVDGELKGLLCAVNTVDKSSYTDNDLDLLVSVSGHAILARNMIRTYKKMGEQQRIHQELEFARTMQSSLMPTATPEDLEEFEVYAHNKPAKEVSGDFYDFIRIDDDRMLLVLGDASGKGVPACMIMTMTRSILRSLCARFTSLEELLVELNDILFKDTEASRFMTMAVVLIDGKNFTVDCARAGHTELLLRNRQNVVFPINPDGPAIGLLPNEFDISFETLCLQFNKGYSLLLFSDGITEALNDLEEEYGLDRLLEVWGDLDVTGEQAVQAILNDVEQFTGDMPQMDDQTIMVISSKKEQ
jgi:sigma-B regulation protein RsbU (phosphoserine phosphatase)